MNDLQIYVGVYTIVVGGQIMDGATEAVNFVTKSHNRTHILRQLADHEYLSRDEFKRRCDVSRTTLQRNLVALEERGWIHRDNRTYTLTTKGERITDELIDLLETVNVAKRLEPFLKCVSSEAVDFEFSQLKDAKVTVADKGNPYAPVNDHIKLMKQSERFRGILPSIGLQPLEIAQKCVERGSDHEVIFGPTAATTIDNDPIYNEPLAEMANADNCKLLIADTEPPFYLGLTNDTVQIGVEDNGKPHALIETDNEDIFTWGERTYHKYKQRSEPFTSHRSISPYAHSDTL